jgi:hypothetical protein
MLPTHVASGPRPLARALLRLSPMMSNVSSRTPKPATLQRIGAGWRWWHSLALCFHSLAACNSATPADYVNSNLEVLESSASTLDASTPSSATNDPDEASDAGDVQSDGGAFPPARSSGIDMSCEQARDCAVKNVGNCCGYFPRCVSAQSEPPPHFCPPDVASVCGWPDITHCECVDNTCRSMQGDQEV